MDHPSPPARWSMAVAVVEVEVLVVVLVLACHPRTTDTLGMAFCSLLSQFIALSIPVWGAHWGLALSVAAAGALLGSTMYSFSPLYAVDMGG